MKERMRKTPVNNSAAEAALWLVAQCVHVGEQHRTRVKGYPGKLTATLSAGNWGFMPTLTAF